MTKTEAARILQESGYKAEVVEGVVIVWTPAPMARKEKDRLRKRLQEIGYRGSWGWRMQEVA